MNEDNNMSGQPSFPNHSSNIKSKEFQATAGAGTASKKKLLFQDAIEEED